jgi:hypothetical protein
MRKYLVILLLFVSAACFALTPKYFISGGTDNNWGTANNWNPSGVPASNDGYIATFNASSPNCVINVTASCNAFDATNYTGTLTVSNTLSVYGNITFGASMIFVGSSFFSIFANSIITSNGKTLPGPYIGIGNGVTITLIGNATCADLTPNGSCVINNTTSETLTCTNGIESSSQMRTVTGNCPLIVTGGGFYNVNISNPVTIAGNVSFNQTNPTGTSCYFGGSVTYSSGTITSTGDNVYFLAGSSINGFTSANYIDNAYFQGAGTVTLNSNFYCNGLNLGTGTNTCVLSGNTIYCASLNSSFTTGTTTGSTTAIVMNGTGTILNNTGVTITPTISHIYNTFQYGGVNHNINTVGNWSQGFVPSANDGYVARFNSSDNCTVNAAFSCNAVDFTGYTGTITMTNPINVYGNLTLGTSLSTSGTNYIKVARNAGLYSGGAAWPNDLQVANTYQIYNLLTDVTINGSLIYLNSLITINHNSTYKLNCNGITGNYVCSRGTAPIYVDGGTIGSVTLANDIYLNGNVTLGNGSLIGLTNSSLNYVSGTITTTGSTLSITNTSNYTLPSQITYNNLTLGNTGAITATLPNIINCNGLLTFYMSSNINFSGAYVINCNGLTVSLGCTINLSGNIHSTGVFTTNGCCVDIIINNDTIYCNGYINNELVSGTTTINLTGGNLGCTSTTMGSINPIIISGSITFNPIFVLKGPLTWSSGTITSTGSTLILQGNSTLDLGGQAINSLTVNGSYTTTLNSDLGINGTFTSTTSTAASHAKFQSNNTTPRTITMGATSSQSVGFTDFIYINGTIAKPIWTHKGILSNTSYINLSPTYIRSEASPIGHP